MIWVCSVDLAQSHESASWVARSVRPFVLTRWDFGPQFAFKAQVAGTFTQMASRNWWSRWWIGGEGYSVCEGVSGGSASGRVAGTVDMSGMNPRA